MQKEEQVSFLAEKIRQAEWSMGSRSEEHTSELQSHA